MIAAHTRKDGVQVLAFDRPERRNAMVPEMMTALVSHLRSLRHSEVRAVVLTGTPPAFCVGADLKWLIAEGGTPGERVAELVAAHHEAVRAMREAPVPIVAAVNGAAAGGGMSLALAADYRIAGMGATFTAAYFRLGLPPDGGNSSFLVRTVGATRALELLLSNRTLTAREAHEWGMVAETVPAGGLDEYACRRAAALATHVSPDTLLTTRRLLDSAGAQPLYAQLEAEEAAMRAAARRSDFPDAILGVLTRR